MTSQGAVHNGMQTSPLIGKHIEMTTAGHFEKLLTRFVSRRHENLWAFHAELVGSGRSVIKPTLSEDVGVNPLLQGPLLDDSTDTELAIMVESTNCDFYILTKSFIPFLNRSIRRPRTPIMTKKKTAETPAHT
ncbi:hypothetical protein J7T55_002197 [Diaporthe amygdali]|uniref:uncharacterized protein n=1 Tax=Phomopsis amygdali TaxID=1214568 RepID=UPI0022FF2024|nr:uncharacterized protein J7T55_002197 [Diaporthe amygdali]KAJ0103778.1 hypothetical protein J7T55_002197 [Diaporthe amygdali]